MNNIWNFRNPENSGLYASVVTTVDGYTDKTVYAGCNHELSSWDWGISATDNEGQYWKNVPGLTSNNYSIENLCLNKKTGTLLFALTPVFDNLPGLGLGVKLKNEDTPFYITAAKDGIAADLITEIYIDENIQTNDELGAVYLLHNDTYDAHGKISKYNVQNKKWTIIESPQWQAAYHNSIRRFNGITYLCSYFGTFSYSKDEVNWTYVTSLNVNSKFNFGFDPGNIPINFADIYVTSNGDMYLLCNYGNEQDNDMANQSFVLKSIDNGKTWDILFLNFNSPFNVIESKGDDLYLYSDSAFRVFNEKTQTVKLFNYENGLVSNDIFANEFFISNDKVYLPTDAGIGTASVSDIQKYPALFDYVTTNNGLSSNTILCISTGNSSPNPGPVLAGGDKGLMGSVDGGKSWKQINSVTQADLKGQQINDILPCWMVNQDYYALATEQIGFVICSNPITSPNGLGWHLTTADGLASNQVKCVLADLLSLEINAYLGHMGEGLTSVLDGKCTVFNKTKGLAGDYVLSIRRGLYQGKAQLYACGFDLQGNPSSFDGMRAALSISSDGGKTWKGINQFKVDGFDFPCMKLYDVWQDGATQSLYGFFGMGYGAGGPDEMMLAKSTDNGVSWTSLNFIQNDKYNEQCNPKLNQVGAQLYAVSSNIFHVFDMGGNTIKEAYWQDGLQGDHTGAMCIDATGQIYIGTNGRGIAQSNLEYIPMYGYYG